MAKLNAVLIGINEYRNNKLSGCINDVLAMDTLLRELCNQQEELMEYNPRFLLAPNTADEFIIEEYCREKNVVINATLPTYANVVASIDHLADRNSDICLLYFSGHGSHTLAPSVFWHAKSDRQNETWVCVDSRDEGGRDLIDKEIAYLLWKSLKEKPDAHCLVITDSCHSGSSTRSAIANGSISRIRHQASSRNDIPLEQYLGYHDGFYTISDGKANFPIARYVHLAACRDSEQAQENMAGGLFTRKLVSMIRDGAGSFSYRRLAQSMTISVGANADEQNPVVFADVEADLELNFLGRSIVGYKKVFIVAKRGQKWILFAGALHSIEVTAIVKIGKVATEVISVSSTTSVLNDAPLATLDANIHHDAVVINSGMSKITIGVGESLKGSQSKLARLQQDIVADRPNYIEFDFKNNDNAEYLADLTTDGQYILTKLNSTEPIFMRQPESIGFIHDVEKVGKWVKVASLTHASATYKASDFIFKIEKIEGQKFGRENIDSIQGVISQVQPDQEHLISFLDGQQPGVRLTIEIAPGSRIESCYVGSLYLDHLFGIDAKGISDENNRLVKGGTQIHVGFYDKRDNKILNTIPLNMVDETEILELVKIIVAPTPFDLGVYEQEALQRDGMRPGFDHNDESGWAVFTHRLRVLGQNKKVILKAGENSFHGFMLDAPEGFRATAYAATRADKKRSLDNLGTRSVSISPPASLWEGVITDDALVGSPSLNNTTIEAIELTLPEGVMSLSLKEGEELILRPTVTRTTSRGAEDTEGTTIPYGYDEENELIFPLGYEDEKGHIHIEILPPPSSGTLDTTPQARSLKSSVKLFFKRVFGRRRDQNVKAVYELIGKGNWKQREFSTNSDIADILKEKTASRVLLLVHGFTGDTEHMVESLKDIEQLHNEVDWVITYDYENLATPIPDTGSKLYQFLCEAGLGKPGMPSLTIIAHSLGGVVNRTFLENTNNNTIAKHLILVGVPSGGTEIATLGVSVLGLISHALNVTGPIKLALKGLCILLRAVKLDPTQVLKELQKTSKVIAQLKKNKSRNGMQVSVIAGDVALLKTKYDGDDPFLKKMKESLVKKVIYPGLTWALYNKEANDMVVTIESMCDIPYFDTLPVKKTVVASGHLSYFRERLIQDELVNHIRSTTKGPVQ